MFRKIMVGIDGSPASEKALAAAVDLAARYQAELTAVGVAHIPEVVGTMDEVEEMRQAAETHCHDIGQAAVAYAKSRGVALRSVVLRGHAADALVRYAENERMELVILGHHGHSRIARFFLGSTTDRVSEHCPCTVMIVK
jgi:nucleotide-binding universal stress UspA family protein